MKKKHLRVIEEIQSRIPKELLMQLMKTETQSPTLKKVIELALTKPDSEIPAQKKKYLQALLDTGRLDRTVDVLDFDIEKQIDEFISEEIALAVKLGRLPKVAPNELLTKKGTQYARRTEARLRREFLGEGNDVDNVAKGDTQGKAEHPSRSSDDGFLRAHSDGADGWH
jgi:hypothetical protein